MLSMRGEIDTVTAGSAEALCAAAWSGEVSVRMTTLPDGRSFERPYSGRLTMFSLTGSLVGT